MADIADEAEVQEEEEDDFAEINKVLYRTLNEKKSNFPTTTLGYCCGNAQRARLKPKRLRESHPQHA